MAVEIARPASMRPRLGRMLPTALAVRNRWAAGPENHRWYIRDTIADGGGKNELWLADVHSCQAATPPTRTTQRHSQLSRGCTPPGRAAPAPPARAALIPSPRGARDASAAAAAAPAQADRKSTRLNSSH